MAIHTLQWDVPSSKHCDSQEIVNICLLPTVIGVWLSLSCLPCIGEALDGDERYIERHLEGVVRV